MWYFETITSTLDRYQIELCKKALEENVVVYLETGCGKTHIAILLMYEMGHLIKKPQKDICIFLAPTVVLVQQVLYFLIFFFYETLVCSYFCLTCKCVSDIHS